MKVTIAQINTTNGDLAGNTRKIIQAIEKARLDGSELVVFPEVATHGYTSQDWFQDADIIEHALDPLREIVPETVGITAIVGTVRPNEPHLIFQTIFLSNQPLRQGRWACKCLLLGQHYR